VIDEVGYLPLDDLGATIFFQLVSARYERGSIILTSNKSYGDWGSIFGDSIIATAILDRLLHHSTTINIRRRELPAEGPPQGRAGATARTRRGGGRGSFLGLGLRSAQSAPKDGAGLTGTMGNFQPELTFSRDHMFWLTF
jgi:IstB-like ATP binding protein